MKNEKYFVCINESYRLSTDLVRGGSMSSIFKSGLSLVFTSVPKSIEWEDWF